MNVDEVAITTGKRGVVLPVKALPGARTNSLRGIINGQLKVSVTVIAEKGKANKAIIDFLSKCLSIPKQQIVLLSGQSSSEKKFGLSGIKIEQLKERLQRLLD